MVGGRNLEVGRQEAAKPPLFGFSFPGWYSSLKKHGLMSLPILTDN